MTEVSTLAAELAAARDDFLVALADLPAIRSEAPLMEGWTGASATLAEAVEREALAMRRLDAALARLDDAALAVRLGNGDTLEDVIRYDGPDHYAEHASHLRAR